MWYEGRRSHARLAIDLALVALSAFIALVIRDNFALSGSRLQGILAYALVCVVSAAIVFSAARLHRTVWRYVSLTDVLRLIAAVTVALLLALLGTFILNRLEGVARSVPVIQLFLLVAGMVGSRIAVRLWGEWKGRQRRQLDAIAIPREHVLIVGLGDLTELYLRSVAEFAPASFVIVGILSPGSELRGRMMRMHKVLGGPAAVQQVIAQLEVHGVLIDRIVVTQPFEQLSGDARAALRSVERSSSIKVDWLIESLGLRCAKAQDSAGSEVRIKHAAVEENKGLQQRRYRHLKRAIDVIGAICLTIVLSPVLALTALLAALDVGFPLVFWQQRPGRYGRPFKLYKFRTMRAAHDSQGNRLPDELRSSSIGRFLRRSWLDELPQLYNILVGEMSFVGPRPLLPVDQPKIQHRRLVVRPGLTGWAQVNGGRDVSPEQKAALDLWYITNASLWLDTKILLRTLGMIALSGLGISTTVHAAATGPEDTTTRATEALTEMRFMTTPGGSGTP